MRHTLLYIKTSLASLYPPEEIKELIRIIMESVCGLSPYQYLSMGDEMIPSEDKSKIENIVNRLVAYEPIQYILGREFFRGLEFNVNPSVLIPRPETAQLVSLIVEDWKESSPRVLDIGTGSGCIAVSIAKALSESTVVAMDVSAEALSVANGNARINSVDVRFVRADVLDDSTLGGVFDMGYDVIVSNPPYIAEKEKDDIERNVLDYEPSLALFVPDENPLLFYKAISKLAYENLNEGGTLYFEINGAFGSETAEAVRSEGFGTVEIIKDYYDKDRIIRAKR
jgi:release factor glutamine methyltransferase